MFRTIFVSSAVLISMLSAASVHAACTYDEAVIAFSGGNLVRGQALMKMAARDGDQRAVRILTLYEHASNERNKGHFVTGDAAKALSDLLLVMNLPTQSQTTVK